MTATPPPPSDRPAPARGGWGRRAAGWRGLWVALVAALSIGAPPAAADAPAPPAVQQLDSAEWRPTPAEAWRPVDLPDTWGRRLGRTSGQGEYRLVFQLDAVPTELWSLHTPRLSPTHSLSLNGQAVRAEAALGRLSPLPTLIDLPPAALRPGRNELLLSVTYRVRGGLAPVQVGPSSLIHQAHREHLFWEREIPRTLNLATAVIALTMLGVWWRRPRELALGLFGLLGLVGAVRNYAYFGDLNWWPASLLERVFFCAQAWTAVLLFAYARQLGAAPPRGAPMRRALLAALAAPPLLVALVPFTALPTLRLLVYPLVIGLALVAVVLVARAARQAGGRGHWLLVASLAACVAAGAHDYLFQQGWLPLTHTFLIASVMPVALTANAVIMLDRMIRGLDEVEQFSQRLEQQVAERTRALQAANAAKARFIAAASHDLRQPAATMGLLLELIAAGQPPAPLGGLVERAQRAARALGGLLDRLLDLSRLEAPGTAPRKRPVALQAVFDAVALDALPQAQARGLRLSFRPTKAWVMSEPTLLEQVLRNLVANAVRYTDTGGVLVAARRRGSGLRVQVWDTGRGIAPEHQAQVFDEFARFPAAGSPGGQGLGLGLAIVDRATAQLGHPRGLRSVPGRGSCFWVDLPGMPERRQAGAAPAPPQAGGRAAPLPPGCTLWLVENDEDLRAAMTAALAARGARVTGFAGYQALAAHLELAQDWPHALVCDWHLGDGTAPDCLALVRAESPLPVAALVVTGGTGPADLARQAQLAVPVLHKPFTVGELADAVGALLANPAFSA